MKEITEEDFVKLTGRTPELGDMERVNCPSAGQAGHHACGWCEEHNRPRFNCLACCLLFTEKLES